MNSQDYFNVNTELNTVVDPIASVPTQHSLFQETFIATAGQTVFRLTLANPDLTYPLSVWVNNQQLMLLYFTYASIGNSITLATPSTLNDIINVAYYSILA